ENPQLQLDIRSDERRRELEPDIIHTKTGHGNQPQARRVELVGGGWTDQEKRLPHRRMLAGYTRIGHTLEGSCWFVTHRMSAPMHLLELGLCGRAADTIDL